MTTSKLFFGTIISMLLLGCGQAQEAKMESSAMADEESNSFVSSTAAVENKKDSTRKFIRTAELKFKVKSVIKSTYIIEELTTKQDGFVTYTNLTSHIDYSTTIPVSVDSSLETSYFTVSNDITLRIPNTKLDSTLKEISKNIDFLDYRIIKADDVGLQILSNNLTQKRALKNETRLTNAIDNKGRKLRETTIAEEVLLNKQEQADNAKIANLSLYDQINYSTITLNIYQRQTVKRELISNDRNIDAYEPNFGSKLLESVQFGWNMLEAFILFLAKLWGLFVFFIVIFIIVRKYWKKLKK